MSSDNPTPRTVLRLADLGILILYGLGVCLYTFPLIIDFSRPFSEIGDYLPITYGLAWQCHALVHSPADFFNANIMFPAANSLALATPLNTAQLVFFAPALALTGNLIKAINTVYGGTIFFTAGSMYYVVRRFGASRSAAFVAGWIFGFALSKIFLSFHMPFFWMVWTFYFWHGFLREERIRDLILSVLFFVGTALGSFYVMFMCFWGLAAWTLGFHLRVRSLLTRRNVGRTLAGGMLAGLLLLPFGLPYFSVSKTYGLKRPLGEVIQYSADPVASYLLPNNRSMLYDNLHFGTEYDPLPGEEKVFGWLVGIVESVAGASVFGDRISGEELSYQKFHSIWKVGDHERRNFLGYSVLFLVVLGCIRKPPPGVADQRYFWRLLLVVALVLSLGPVLISLGHLTYIPGPYALLYYAVPGMQGLRAVARYSSMAMMAAAALAAYGWGHIEWRLKDWCASRKYPHRVILGLVLAVWVFLFTVENMPAFSPPHEGPPEPPPVYDWLKTRQLSGGIIEIPTFKGSMRKTDPVYGARRVAYSHREYLYMYYSASHWKPIYNGFGAFISPLQFQVRDAVERLPDLEAIDVLKRLDLRTFVLHRYWFEPEDEVFWNRPEVMAVVELIEEIDGAEIYRLR